jgi:hypothetical protein
VIMGKFAKYPHNVKAIVLAVAMGLVALNAVAQQEVDPDHFDGSQTVPVQKSRVMKVRKQAAPTQNANAASKPSVRQAKASKSSGPKVVTVAAH